VDERAFDDLLEWYRWEFAVEDPSLLDWTGTMRVRPRITDPPVRDVRPDAPARNTVVFAGPGERLTHSDGSIHVVVVDEQPSATRLAEARRVARDLVVVWARDGSVSRAWEREHAPRSPAVTLLVHATGSAADRDVCLRSIAQTTAVTGAIEVLVTDPDPARGAIAALNEGAEAARGGFLILVGDRTRVLPGWLRPLVRTLRESPDVGVVGGKLVGDAEVAQEGGGVLFADGSTAAFGRGLTDPYDPVLGYVREVDFVSASLLATRSGLLRCLGGFDDLLGESHADVDYCLRVRGAGRRIVFQPQSAVLAPSRAPADPASDARARFVRRWASSLAALPARPEQLDAAAWGRLAQRA